MITSDLELYYHLRQLLDQCDLPPSCLENMTALNATAERIHDSCLRTASERRTKLPDTATRRAGTLIYEGRSYHILIPRIHIAGVTVIIECDLKPGASVSLMYSLREGLPVLRYSGMVADCRPGQRGSDSGCEAFIAKIDSSVIQEQ